MAGYQIKVTMEQTKPPMWRRLAIPEQITFLELHKILQLAFGWDNYHLHDFRLQHSDEYIADKKNAEADYEEANLLVDDVLKEGWIRYTYDFGDDWRHKIVLEKDLPEYEYRYPQVIKFKGNNFEEDSGIWGGREQGDYDMAAVNDNLKQYCVCKIYKKNKTISQVRSKGRGYDKEIAAIDEFIKLMQKMETKTKKSVKPAPIDKRLDLLSNFYERVSDIDTVDERQLVIIEPLKSGKQGERTGKEKQYTQIAFDWGKSGKLVEEAAERKEISVEAEDAKTMVQLLTRAGKRHLSNYIKYLTLQHTMSATASQMAKQVASCIREHPEYLLLVLHQEEVYQYLRLYDGGELSELPDEELLAVTSMWGLLDVVVETAQGSYAERLRISFPADVEPIVVWLRQTDLPAYYRKLQKEWEQIELLLMCYGFINMDTMHEKYIKAFSDVKQADFYRYLYLHGRFRNGIATGTFLNGKAWVAVGEAFADKAAVAQQKYAIGLDYADFTKKQIRSMKLGFGYLYPQWDAVAALLLQIQLVDRDAFCLLSDLYEMVQEGRGMKALLAYIQMEIPGIDNRVLRKLQVALVKCWCETGISALKNHSRREIAEARNVSVYDVASEDGFRMPELLTKAQWEMTDSGECGPDVTGTKMTDWEILDVEAPCPCGSGKRYKQCCGRKTPG